MGTNKQFPNQFVCVYHQDKMLMEERKANFNPDALNANTVSLTQASSQRVNHEAKNTSDKCEENVNLEEREIERR